MTIATDTDHECPAPGCTVVVAFELLACRAHWYQLPANVRSDVWRAYRRHGVGSPEHTAAISAAFEWWNDRS